MNLNLISAPSPLELYNEHSLELSEKMQEYFDSEIKPKLNELITSGFAGISIPGEIKYFAYVESALKSKGWTIKWDRDCGPGGRWVISRREPFNLFQSKYRFTGIRALTVFMTIVFLIVATDKVVDLPKLFAFCALSNIIINVVAGIGGE